MKFDFNDGYGPVNAKRHINQDGTKGGWVAATAKVDSTCYIGYNAMVYGKAHVSGNAQVYGYAQVFGNARVFENSQVYGNSWVYGYAQVSGNAHVFGDAWVYGNAKISSGTPNKSLNHKSIIDAFEDVYKEFSQMSETEFKEMINESDLPTLGETNKPKEMKKKIYCINCKYIKCYDPYELSCGHPTNMVETSGVYRCCVEPIETIKTLNKNNECKLYKKKWYKFWVK